MTRNHTAWVALLLVFLLSIAVGSATAATPDETITNNGNYWVGQTLEYSSDSIANDDTVRLRYSANDTLVKELPVNNGSVVFDTSELTATDYYLESSDGSSLVSFTLSKQTVSVSSETSEVKNSKPDSSLNMTVESERNNYALAVKKITRDGETISLSKDALGRLFNGDVVFKDYDEDGSEEAVIKNISSTDELRLSFAGVKAGEYTVDFEVADVQTTSSLSVTVKSASRATGRFNSQFYETHRGNLVELPVELNNTNRATVVIGGEDYGYTAVAKIKDGGNSTVESDGIVTLVFDTAAAGQTDAVSPVLTTKDSADSVTVVNETTLDNQLEATQYLLNLKVDGEVKSLSALQLKSVQLNGVETRVVPGTASLGTFSSFTSSKDETAAMQDKVLVYFKFKGMNRYFATQDSASDFARDSKAANRNYLYLSVVEQNTSRNKQPRRLDVDRLVLYNNPDSVNGVAFLLDPEAYSGLNPGDTYEFRLNLMEENPYVSEDTILRSQVTFAESETSLYTHRKDKVVIANRNSQVFSGNTSLAPNSTVTVVAQSEGQYPFHREATTTVGPDGSFNATADFGNLELPIGYEFTVTVKPTGEQYTGVVVPASELPGSNDESNSVDLSAEFTVDNASTTTGEPVTFDASKSIPSEKIVSYKWDFNDGAVGGGETITHTYSSPGTYYVELVVTTADGKQAKKTKVITVKSNTPTPTETPTPTPTPNNTSTTPTPSPTPAPGQPGFTLVTAVLAVLLGGAYLSLRD